MKKIIASLIAVATVFSLSAVAFAEAATEAPAADPGSTNGKQEEQVKVEEGKPTEVVLDNGVKVVAEEGAFPADTEVKIVADPQPVDQAAEATKVEAIDKAVQEMVTNAGDIQVVTKIDISILDAEGNAIQPAEGKKVKVTVAWDGVSNAIAYVGDDGKVEFYPLTVDKTNNTATFEVSHFSDYYMVSVSEEVIKSITGEDTNPPKDEDDKNKPTGVALVVIPAAIAAAAVVISKKRK